MYTRFLVAKKASFKRDNFVKKFIFSRIQTWTAMYDIREEILIKSASNDFKIQELCLKRYRITVMHKRKWKKGMGKYSFRGNWRILPVETIILEPNVSSFKMVSQTVCNKTKKQAQFIWITVPGMDKTKIAQQSK